MNHWPYAYYKWKVFRKSKGNCIYFELKFSDLHDPRFTIAYLIPITKGGVDDLSNVYPCCKNCNTHRRSLPLNEWFGLLKSKKSMYKGIYHIIIRLDKIVVKLDYLFGELFYCRLLAT